jgi:hypothetical protein
MGTKEIDRVFNELIQDNAQMDAIGVDRKLRYKFRNPEKQPISLAKKLEILYKCNRLTLV